MATTVYGNKSPSGHNECVYITYSTSETDTAKTINLSMGISSKYGAVSVSGMFASIEGELGYREEDDTLYDTERYYHSGDYSLSKDKTQKWLSKTLKFSKTHTKQTIKVAAFVSCNNLIFGYSLNSIMLSTVATTSNTSYKTLTFTIPAKTSYKITYNANGGTYSQDVTPPSTQTKWYNESIQLSNVMPTRTGYRCIGWSPTSTATSAGYRPGGECNYNGNLTLYATWEPLPIPLNFDINDNNSGGTNPSSKLVAYNSTYGTLPTVSWTGYKFLGWYTARSDGDLVTSTTKMTSTDTKDGVTIYAHWAEAYRVSYHSGPNSQDSTITGVTNLPQDQTKYANEALILNPDRTKPIRQGYTHVGWTDGASITYDYTASTWTLADNVNHNVDLYSIWSLNTYTITYQLNDGEFTYANVPTTFTINSPVITLKKPKRDGYDFLGWIEEGSGSTTPERNMTIGVNSYGNKTFIANWGHLYEAPANLKVDAKRCNAEGREDESGDKGFISFGWDNGSYDDRDNNVIIPIIPNSYYVELTNKNNPLEPAQTRTGTITASTPQPIDLMFINRDESVAVNQEYNAKVILYISRYVKTEDDRLDYVKTKDTVAIGNKTYYTRTGNGTATNLYTYASVSTQIGDDVSGYYEDKPYYTRTGEGTDQSPYIYTIVSNRNIDNLGTYYELITYDPITQSDYISQAFFIMDINSDGTAIGFGTFVTDLDEGYFFSDYGKITKAGQIHIVKDLTDRIQNPSQTSKVTITSSESNYIGLSTDVINEIFISNQYQFSNHLKISLNDIKVEGSIDGNILWTAKPNPLYVKTQDDFVVSGKQYYTLSGTTYTEVPTAITSELHNYYENTIDLIAHFGSGDNVTEYYSSYPIPDYDMTPSVKTNEIGSTTLDSFGLPMKTIASTEISTEENRDIGTLYLDIANYFTKDYQYSPYIGVKLDTSNLDYYIATTDTEYNSSKTYYIRSGSAAPYTYTAEAIPSDPEEWSSEDKYEKPAASSYEFTISITYILGLSTFQMRESPEFLFGTQPANIHQGGKYIFQTGEQVYASTDHQAVFGRANKYNAKSALIVGNGTITKQENNSKIITQSNAFEVDWEGNVWLYFDPTQTLDGKIKTALDALNWKTVYNN